MADVVAYTPACTGDGLEVVVGSDGDLRVLAAELVRHGMYPGARLRVLIVGEESRTYEAQGDVRPKQAQERAGALAYMVTLHDVDAFAEALAGAKADRIPSLDAM